MQNYESQPLHEVIYFSRGNKITHSFSLNAHISIRTALKSPSYYLPVYDDDPLSDVFPDTSILFQLHLEYGKMINMSDLLDSFSLSVTGETNEI